MAAEGDSLLVYGGGGGRSTCASRLGSDVEVESEATGWRRAAAICEAGLDVCDGREGDECGDAEEVTRGARRRPQHDDMGN